jgi:hypothetical protein
LLLAYTLILLALTVVESTSGRRILSRLKICRTGTEAGVRARLI